MNQIHTTPFVSVIVPVYNDREQLKTCLYSLQNQTYPPEQYEVIVVDNNSQEDITEVTAQFKRVVFASEKRPGSYAARNKGLTIAKGSIIAFTDADCITDPTWLENGVEALLKESNIGLVAGRIDLFPKDANNPTPFEIYECLEMGFPQDKFLEDDHFGVTANLFTFKTVFEDVGCFNDTLKSGGDLEWGQRVFAKGYRQVYADRARVKHPTRNSWWDLRKRAIRIIGGKYDLMRQKNQSNLAAFKDLILFLKPPFRSFFRIWADKRLQGASQKLKFTFVMLLLRYVSIQERLRLQLGGGISDRG